MNDLGSVNVDAKAIGAVQLDTDGTDPSLKTPPLIALLTRRF